MPWKTVLNTATDTGSEFLVSDQAALALDAESACPCIHAQLGKFEVTVGETQRPYYELCTECGALFKAISKKSVIEKLAFFDHLAAKDRFARSRYERRMAIIRDDADQNGHAIRERTCNYPAYLRSLEWKEKRQAVFKRANFVCEECHKEEATEVHHLTYDRIFLKSWKI